LGDCFSPAGLGLSVVFRRQYLSKVAFLPRQIVSQFPLAVEGLVSRIFRIV